MVAYTIHTDAVRPGGEIALDLYLTGRSEANALVFANALDPVTLDSLGRVQVYPGMAPTDALDPDALYRAPLTIPLDDGSLPPRELRIRLEWFDPTTLDYLPLTDATGAEIESLLLRGPVLIDDGYAPGPANREVDADFGGAIRLTGYTLSSATLQPGDALTIRLNWRALDALPDAWTLTVQMFNEDGLLVDQADGAIPGYPSSAWVAGTRFSETRTLSLPDDAGDGDYRLVVAWYRLTDSGFERLPVTGDLTVLDDLALLPVTLNVPDDPG
jgi:hypothetical protein